jgi:signal transduction histidine kinase
MVEQIVCPQDESIAHLQERVALLEQQNALLQSRLQAYESSQLSPQSPISASTHCLLEATAFAANALLTIDNFDQAINTALQILGDSLETDRIKVLESLFDDPTRPFSRYHNVLHEWIRPGTVQQRSLSQAKSVDTRNLEGFFETFVQNKGFSGLLSEWDASLQALFPGAQVKSLCAVPIWVNGQWWGVLASDHCQEAKHHTSAELAALQTAANCIGSAIQRQRMQQAREAAEQQVLLCEQAAQERAAELAKANEALKRSLNALATELSLESFLGSVLMSLAEQFESTTAEYWTHADNQTAYIEMMAWEGRAYRRNEIAEMQPDHPGVIGYEVPSAEIFGEPLSRRTKHFVTEDLSDYSVAGETALWLYQRGFHKQINVPLNVGERTVGALVVRMHQQFEITPEKVELAWALANQVALVLEMSRLAEEAQQAAVAKLNEVIAREQEKAAQERATELERANDALARTAARLTEQGDLNHFFDELLLETSRQLEADSAHLVVYDNKQRRYTSLHQHNGNVKLEPELPASFSLDEMQPENFHTIAQRERCPHWYDPQADADLFSPGAGEFLSRAGLRSVLHVPLIVGEQIVGGIGFAFRKPYPENSQRPVLVEALAHQAALAIQLIQLAEEAQQAALLKERNRMAGEIHDSLSQSFIGVLMQLQIADDALASEPNQAQACITRAQSLAKEGLTEARLSVWSLCQENTDYCFIAETLSRIVEQLTTGTPIQATVHTKGTPYCLQAEVGMNLLRIAQESLTNSLRHAQADTIQVHLTYAPDHTQLCIQDNGRGFDPQHQRSGFGLINIQQRAEQIGAQFQLQTQLEAGTMIAVTVPI